MGNDPAHAATAEVVAGRELATGNAGQQNSVRTQRRAALSQALERVRQAAKENGKRWTARWHPVYAIDRLREASDRKSERKRQVLSQQEQGQLKRRAPEMDERYNVPGVCGPVAPCASNTSPV